MIYRPIAFLRIGLMLLVSTLAAHSADKALPRSTPEQQGISSAAVRDFIETADKQIHTLHSFMLVRHGHVIAEAWWKPESAEKRHVMWSLSKSFTSTAIGLAVAEAKLTLNDPVLKFFPMKRLRRRARTSRPCACATCSR